ncbi:unnamed protein product [Pleuronectes platessa]|uniref:Uncharacterized protein n=1 Tax=Pleuronectes platessa TaxID=8262 RepID=A0A9N7Z380_PLEPL|nr:unnamed protein product [Pleuronectes platessa]
MVLQQHPPLQASMPRAFCQKSISLLTCLLEKTTFWKKTTYQEELSLKHRRLLVIRLFSPGLAAHSGRKAALSSRHGRGGAE